jgi:hypothetical protein
MSWDVRHGKYLTQHGFLHAWSLLPRHVIGPMFWLWTKLDPIGGVRWHEFD